MLRTRIVAVLLAVVGIATGQGGLQAADDAVESALVLQQLRDYLKKPTDPPLLERAFASAPLTKDAAHEAEKLLWNDHVARIRRERAAEMKARQLQTGDHVMRFDYIVFGERPKRGRSLFISLHGGGGTAARVNDQQWENQKKLYRPKEGVYLAPRAPTDTWNLWHQPHIDALFDRLIENLIVFEDVDPERVYVMGYSAGGDGVYQLAPRMADRWAAAAMMAGHPNDARPLGLRNTPFTLHMGERDAAYRRNQVAQQWKLRLAELQKGDPQGYIHDVQIHADKGHWMEGQDAVAVDWMAKHRRRTFPKKIVWRQDDVAHSRFYWLAVETEHRKRHATVIARREGQQIELSSTDVARITIRLNDTMLDLDQPVVVRVGDQVAWQGKVARTIKTLARTLQERGDPTSLFSSELSVDLARRP